MSIYVIDSKKEVMSAAGEALSSAAFSENEIVALNQIATGRYTIVFLHFFLLNKGTPEFIEILRKANSAVEIVVVGNQIENIDIINCILAGAKGYQELDTLGHYAEKLIQVISTGEAWISRRMIAKLIDYWQTIKQ